VSEVADVTMIRGWSIHRRTAHHAVLVCAGLLLAVLGLTSVAPAQEVRYIYDELNRLIGVVDQQGNAAEYVYDAVGNIIQVKRFTVDPNAAVGITLVRPNSGPIGATVQIFGKGSAPRPATTSCVSVGPRPR